MQYRGLQQSFGWQLRLPVLLTYNDEQNIARTLSHIRWVKDIVVVDSGSTDATLAIIAKFPNRRFNQDAESIWSAGLSISSRNGLSVWCWIGLQPLLSSC